MVRIGLISDTHGLLRPQALDFLRGSDHIVHAGDIGDPSILVALSAIAPVIAVRGNNDQGPWAGRLRQTDELRLGDWRLLAIHDLAQLVGDPGVIGLHTVISGHTHRPQVERRGGVLYVNPGSAGPRRFRLPVSLGDIVLDGGSVTARTVELADLTEGTRIDGRDSARPSQTGDPVRVDSRWVTTGVARCDAGA